MCPFRCGHDRPESLNPVANTRTRTRAPGIGIAINAAIDSALVARNRAQPPRGYVGTSGLGRECLRQIQYDYLAVPKDEGRSSSRRRCAFSRPAIAARTSSRHGCVPPVSTCARNVPMAGSSDFRRWTAASEGHIDGCLLGGPVAMEFPALWENKALGAASWKEVVKKGVVLAKPLYAAQIALYQAYLDLPNPALFTALNRDTWELHCELVPFDAALAQSTSDRAVLIVRASDAQELLPRAAADKSSAICRGGKTGGEWHPPCSWQDRCWRAMR